MRRGLGAALVAGLLLAGGPACADDVPVDPAAVSAEDRASVATCLREAADLPRACIGTVAVVCARRGPGETGAIECSRREAAVWRERLDVVGAALAGRLESGPRSRLAAAQRAWDAYVVQKCAFAAEMQRPERAPSMQAACELREVAVRAIELERLAARSTTERPSERPRIER